jgi:type IV pilus assembly protein PilN
VIRINLLATERKAAKRALAFDPAKQITAVCATVLLVATAVIGWRYWRVSHDGTRVDEEIAAAQQETRRLHSVIVQVQQFEQRKAQLQQRVTLIEQLRKAQVGPVHMLDEISLSLPDTMWLTEMKQTGAPNEVLIEGRSLSLTGLSDFVANLERSGAFQRSVEIVNTTTEAATDKQPEVVKFQIKAVFRNPAEAPSSASAGGVTDRTAAPPVKAQG